MGGIRNYIREFGLGRRWLKLRQFVKKPFSLSYRSKVFFKAIKFYLYNSWLTNFPSYRVRTVYLRKVLKISIGQHSAIHMGCFFAGSNITIGTNSVIARACYLDGRVGPIKIGNNVSIAPECYILSLTHITNSSTFESIAKEVIIEDYAWLGARCMVLPGVIAQKGCVLAAGSVVTKSVNPFEIVAGVPAKKIGVRNNKLDYKLYYFPFFNTDLG